MCGIFGIIGDKKKFIKDSHKENNLYSSIDSLFESIERRGKDSSGLIVVNSSEKKINIIKNRDKITNLAKIYDYKKILNDNNDINLAAHSRMATHGKIIFSENNQPCIKNNLIVLHNGIITNHISLKKKFQFRADLDTSLINKIVSKFKKKYSTFESIKKLSKLIKGSNTFIIFIPGEEKIYFYSSNGSLYFTKNNGLLIYASEKIFLQNILKKLNKKSSINKIILNKIISFKDKNMKKINKIDLILKNYEERQKIKKNININTLNYKFKYNLDNQNIRLCKKCILPSTFPSITFNEKGICSICLNFVREEISSKKITTLIKKKDKILVPISGGRDSCYTLHYLSKQFNNSLIAYTYDWGFVTDIARENISNMCGELGIEHILIAADIKQKRKFVRMNLLAWLKNINLGMLPLLMAGDKFFFDYAQTLKKEHHCSKIFFSHHKYEKTFFKSGFIGSNNYYGNNKKIYALNLADKLNVLFGYSKEFLFNSSYINSSLIETVKAYFSFYINKNYHDYYSIFDYQDYDENKIIKTLIKKYNWSKGDNNTSWRIGDMITPFSNYCYYVIAGFNEHHTFRSNQIRDNKISRNEALNLVKYDNAKYEKSFINFCKVINVDVNFILDKINNAKKLY